MRAWLVTQRATAGEGWRADEGVRAHDEREEEAAKMPRGCHCRNPWVYPVGSGKVQLRNATRYVYFILGLTLCTVLSAG